MSIAAREDITFNLDVQVEGFRESAYQVIVQTEVDWEDTS